MLYEPMYEPIIVICCSMLTCIPPRSVKYKLNYQFPHKAGVGWTIPALAVSCMLNLALEMELVVMYRGKRAEDQWEP